MVLVELHLITLERVNNIFILFYLIFMLTDILDLEEEYMCE